mgnify:FL=1
MSLATKRFASLHDCIIEEYVFKCTLNIKELIQELVNIYTNGQYVMNIIAIRPKSFIIEAWMV